jgi:hypothetical protein
MSNYLEDCGSEYRWLFLGVGVMLALVGGILTASIIGAVVGIPLLLVAWPLLESPGIPATCS